MKEYTINNRHEVGNRLDHFLQEWLPYIPKSLLHKSIRLKKIKINGKKVQPEYRLNMADQIQIFINDELIQELQFDIVYEDENILLVDKKTGIVCHDDKIDSSETLISSVRAYLNYSDRNQGNIKYQPELCNRIDRNTGGIVIIAKNLESKRILDEKIKNHEIKKYYICVVQGVPKQKIGRLENQLFKDSVKSISVIVPKKEKKTRTAITDYRILVSNNKMSLLECIPITGRTHQIRAQLAHAGHSIIGDMKYGNKVLNKLFHEKRQLLYSYKIKFEFPTDAGKLQYLKSESFAVANVKFCKKHFPEVVLETET